MKKLSSALPKRGIFWFRHDLRLHDNPALVALSEQVDELLCVFIIDPRWFKSSHFQSAHMGDKRWAFLQQSLSELQRHLQEQGQQLFVLEGETLEVLDALIGSYTPDIVASGMHPGVYERQQWQRVKQGNPNTLFIQENGHSLFQPATLPFEIEYLPASFTPFRKRVEDLQVAVALPAPTALPPAPDLAWLSSKNVNPPKKAIGLAFTGGEDAALAQLEYTLFTSHNIKNYKQTRNGLDGWDYSSKLSPWLANGCLSVRQVFTELRRYESEYEKNDSTYWLYFELLWREYFQWHLFKYQSKLFQFSGTQDTRPLTTFVALRFAMWCQGETPYPIVNACMKQLNHTGYMSNRGRQLVASCLVNELGVDWRFGAAYFEQQLVDFDVASNWGNWQYLSGVGVDPRGHRRFDLAKQAQQYDPNGEFVRQWAGDTYVSGIDQTDAADWPLG
ncbi:deoxyribodipyrimidine photo-lyase (single-stranded DNA-specific) [Paraglaciecola sp. T6c]|uniref:DASH family cryptochrome n=1 Tax=Pseudoalteromonas atlantica (strain T6c / ATCC BAA-1087) TaxID=3042615 RepID=UPI00005C5752|nr:DASH family cryptochrome [Paraglaciecola sp. T6c]ABG38684.1 deoxyribodipyrimidine photo-lyase (single-stranded DNA-specific) [Paraglaciecola sp. T6c]